MWITIDEIVDSFQPAQIKVEGDLHVGIMVYAVGSKEIGINIFSTDYIGTDRNSAKRKILSLSQH